MATWEEYGTKTEARLKSKVQPMESIILGGKRQLFVDNYVIEHMGNLHRVLHQPTKHEANPVLKPDRPWEGRIGWASVIRDEEADCFKAWYSTENGLAYATSDDGVQWNKPSLGIIEWNGSKENNLLLQLRFESPTIIKDSYETDPQRRYKLFGLLGRPVYGMYVAFSQDGIHWKLKEQPVLTSANDPGLNDHPTMMHDTERKRYIAFTKREMINPYGRGDWGIIHRCRCFSLSNDFEKWTNPVLTLRPDDRDPPDLQIYGLVGFNYEGLYLGLIDVYWSRETGPMERTIETQLACSRDGEVWWRAGNRQTFIPLGPEGSWDQFIVAPNNCPPISMGNELWFFYTGGSHRHRMGLTPNHRRREPWLAPDHPEDPPLEPGTPRSGMGIARLRRDGFVSLDAGPRSGRLLTLPLIFDGKHLHVNADAKLGSIRAELFAAEKIEAKELSNSPSWNWAIGEPIQGFSLDDCISVRDDTTDGIIRWKGPDNLEKLSGQHIVIRFNIVQAALYSFWIE